jgi:hypothetical protein
MPNAIVSPETPAGKYQVLKHFETDIRPGFHHNFDPYTFLKSKITKDGEISLEKGLWQFRLSFECEIVMTNGSLLLQTQEPFGIDFGVKVFLNNELSNDRPRFIYMGYKDGMCNYEFEIVNFENSSLFRLEFNPSCRRRDGSALVNLPNVSIVMKNFSFIGSKLFDVDNV